MEERKDNYVVDANQSMQLYQISQQLKEMQANFDKQFELLQDSKSSGKGGALSFLKKINPLRLLLIPTYPCRKILKPRLCPSGESNDPDFLIINGYGVPNQWKNTCSNPCNVCFGGTKKQQVRIKLDGTGKGSNKHINTGENININDINLNLDKINDAELESKCCISISCPPPCCTIPCKLCCPPPCCPPKCPPTCCLKYNIIVKGDNGQTFKIRDVNNAVTAHQKLVELIQKEKNNPQRQDMN